ncbi:MAG: potassium channel family protein [Candidatus Omnitrophota bacterium]
MSGLNLSSYNIGELWNLSAEDFNKWRQDYDLPLLFEFFKEKLPGFSEWIDKYEPEKNYFLKIVPSGKIFKGDSELFIVEYEQSNEKKLITAIVPSLDAINNIPRRFKDIRVNIKRSVPFIPYLLWGKRKFKKEKFICHDPRNHQYSDSFVFNSWADADPKRSRANLFQNFSALKLGGIEIKNTSPMQYILFGERNLDFVDLDYLKLNGTGTGSRWSEISYSSLREVQFSNKWYSFFSFFDCHIEEMLIKDGKIQDFQFINNNHMDISFNNVSINKLVFKNSYVRMDFDKCDINEILYVPPKRRALEGAFHNYRKIRTAYQNIGKRIEARKYYYFERCSETRMLASFVRHNRDSFPLRRKYSGTIFDIFDQYRNGQFGFKESIKHLVSVMGFYLRIFLIPKYLMRAIKYFFQFISSFADYLIWGYGERPFRVFVSVLLTISLFSVAFYHSSHPELYKLAGNSIYFSIITFTTLGYGDISPKGYPDLRMLCSIEALIGVLLIGLFVAGFANRSKY